MTYSDKFFERAYGKELTEAETTEYRNRLTKFVELLIEIDQTQKSKEKENDN